MANEESIQNQKTQLNEIVSDIDQLINVMVSVNNSLNALDANVSMQSSLDQDQEYRISQLEKQTNATDEIILILDARTVELETNLTLEQLFLHELNTNLTEMSTTNQDNIQKIDERVSILENDSTSGQAISDKLNETLIQLSFDILANEDAIGEQQIQLNGLSSDIDQSVHVTELVNNSLKALEANLSMRIVSDQDQDTRILQLEKGSNMTDESVQNLVKRVANLKTNMTAEQLFSRNLNANLTKMSTNIFANEEEILKLKTQITEIEVGNGVDQGNIQTLKADTSFIETIGGLGILIHNR